MPSKRSVATIDAAANATATQNAALKPLTNASAEACRPRSFAADGEDRPEDRTPRAPPICCEV